MASLLAYECPARFSGHHTKAVNDFQVIEQGVLRISVGITRT